MIGVGPDHFEDCLHDIGSLGEEQAHDDNAELQALFDSLDTLPLPQDAQLLDTGNYIVRRQQQIMWHALAPHGQAFDSSNGGAPLSAVAMAQVQAPPQLEGGSGRIRKGKGLSQAELETSRRFRARKKAMVAAMEQEVRDKMAQVEELQHQNAQLAARQAALEVMVATSSRNMEILSSGIQSVKLEGSPEAATPAELEASSGSSPSDTGTAEGEQAASPAAAQPLAAPPFATNAVPVELGWAAAMCENSSATSTPGSERLASHASTSTPGSWQQQQQDITSSPQFRAVLAGVKETIHNITPLVLQLGDPIQGSVAAQRIDAMLQDFRSKMRLFALSNPMGVRLLELTNLSTGEPLDESDGPDEQHWRRVVAMITLDKPALGRLGAAYELYRSKRAAIVEERQQLMQQLKALDSPGHMTSAMKAGPSGQPAMLRADERTLLHQSIMPKIDRTLLREHVLMASFKAGLIDLVGAANLATVLIHSYPFMPDVDKVMAQVLQLSQFSL